MKLFSLPRARKDLEDAMALPDAGLRDLAGLILLDPPLTGRILRSVNSSWHRLPEPLLSVERAVTVLGFDELRNLIQRSPTFASTPSLSFKRYNGSVLWRRSRLRMRVVGQMVEKLACLRRFGAEELRAASVLCDIGQHALLEALGDEWVRIVRRARDEERALDELEVETLGFSHCELGGMMLKRWSLPEAAIAAARFHHGEGRVAWVEPVAAAIHMADVLARTVEENDRHARAELLPAATRLLGLQDQDWPRWVDITQVQRDKD